MSYQSLYLKYRPQTFDEVIGQDHICRTLRNALATGKPAHAYLFCGPRGTGKTTTARILAKALSCETGITPDPCGECDACQAIPTGRLLDVVEIDAASNTGVDNIRELKEVIGYAPSWGRFRIYIIDEVHMLSTAAWNALLKTLEEPPDHAYFVMATTDPQKVLPTILSRCQRFDFRRVPQPDLVEHLKGIAKKEDIEAEEPVYWAIARLSEGCVRDSITLFDQVRAYATGTVGIGDVHAVLGTLDLDVLFTATGLLAERDAAGAFRWVDELAREGKDFAQVIHGLTGHVRNLMLVKSGCTSASALEADEATVERLVEQAGRFAMERLVRILGELSDAREDLKWNHQHRLVLEVALVRMMADGGLPKASGNPSSLDDGRAPDGEPEPPVATEETEAVEADLEPEAAPGPEPEPPSEDDDEPIPVASEEWQKVALEIAQLDPKLGKFIIGSVAERRGGTELIVTFDKKFGADLFRDTLKDAQAGGELRRVIEATYGTGLAIRAANDAQAVSESNGAPATPPDATAMVLDMFEDSKEL